MTVYAANCHLIKGNRVLLKLANQGVSKGYWNCPGGKMEKGETPRECAIREVKEETGLDVKNLFAHGKLSFFFARDKNPDWVVYLFSSKSFSGRMRGSSEGRLKWFGMDRIPYDKMWDDDRYWLSLMFDKRRFDASFVFDKDNRISNLVIKFLEKA
jgi:8-oxo-dGTP diphosphatase